MIQEETLVNYCKTLCLSQNKKFSEPKTSKDLRGSQVGVERSENASICNDLDAFKEMILVLEADVKYFPLFNC